MADFFLQVDKEGGVGMEDAAGFFANVFGGERFKDYVSLISSLAKRIRAWSHLSPCSSPAPSHPQIGEISLMK